MEAVQQKREIIIFPMRFVASLLYGGAHNYIGVHGSIRSRQQLY